MKPLVLLCAVSLMLTPSALAWAQEGGDGLAQAAEGDGKSGTDAARPKARNLPKPVTAAPGLITPPPPPAADDARTPPTPGDDSAATAGSADKSTTDAAAGGSSTSAATAAPAERKVLAPFPKDTLITIDYDGVELKDIIKDFAEKTGRNFLLDAKVSGKVTIISPKMVTVEAAYEAFIAAMDAAGFTTVVLVRDSKGNPVLTRIMDAKDARSEPIQIYKNGSSAPKGTSQLITRLVQLQNVAADEISKVVQGMISPYGDMIAYAPANTLIITDSAVNITRIVELISELDVSAPRQKLEVVQVRFAEAAKLVDIITQLYGTAESAKKSSGSAATAAKDRVRRRTGDKEATAPAAASLESVGEETTFIGKMIADERTNSIIVLATEKAISEIKDLIAELDYEVDPAAQADIQVVYLEHAKAEELSQTLNSLIQTTNQRQAQRRTAGGNAANNATARGGAAERGDNDGARGGNAGAPGELGGNFQGEVRIAHDVPTNSLVITAGRDDFRRLRRVIDMLDIARKQVFVETVIMEVSDTRRKDAGVSWHGGVPGKGEVPVNGIFARGSDSVSLASSLLDGSMLAGIAAGIFGNSINIPIPGIDGGFEIPMFGLVLHALQEDTSTNVLSAPNILTMDNEEATIEVGETVPFPTGGLGGLSGLSGLAGAAGISGLSGLGGLSSLSYTREDVGIILRLTPQVGENDNVILDIYQEISEVKEGSAAANGGGGPTTTKRSAETHVAVRSNQTIVIGGLMQEVETENEGKVPILGDIPLIGALFRNKAKTKRKTNLLIFLTPHVIDEAEDLQEIYQVKMLQRQEFMRRFYGKTPEEQRAQLNELIRYSMNLPDEPSAFRHQEPKPKYEPESEDGEEELSEEEAEALREALAGQGGTLITPDGEQAPPPPPFEVDAGPETGSDAAPAGGAGQSGAGAGSSDDQGGTSGGGTGGGASGSGGSGGTGTGGQQMSGEGGGGTTMGEAPAGGP